MDVPQFGDPAPACRTRPSAYALVRDGADRVLCVRAGGALHLPGGGIHAGETPEAAVLRELAEETGVVGEVVRAAGRANQYYPGVAINKLGHFFVVRPRGRTPARDADHEPVWLPAAQAARELRYAFQRWAVTAAGTSSDGPP